MTIQENLSGLIYKTGTDFDWTYVENFSIQPVSWAEVKYAAKRGTFSSCQMLDYGEFKQNLIDNQPQSSEYQALFDAIERQLSNISVFKIRPSASATCNYDIYVAGKKDDTILVLLYTAGLET